jgi:1-acyl-sn-glycerol-3-phosphate acyltransferase
MRDQVRFWPRAVATFLLMTAGSLVMLASALLTAFSAPRFYRERIGAPLGRMALAIWGVRYVVHGTPAPAHVQTVYVSNHTSTLDMFVLIALGLPNTRFFLSGYLRKLLPLGLIGYLIGIFWTVPQSFPDRRTRIFQRAERVLRRTGESVYLSPEGERITSGEIGHFNKGAFHLATALGAPIVPMYLRVPRTSDPGKGLHARPGTVEVYFRPPIDTRAWRIEDVVRNRDRMRDFYVDWHRELREA